MMDHLNTAVYTMFTSRTYIYDILACIIFYFIPIKSVYIMT